MTVERLSTREIQDALRPVVQTDKPVERARETASQATPPPAAQARVAAEQLAQMSQAGAPAAVSGRGTIISVKV